MKHDNCRENVHIMVLPVAETIEKQLMVVLRDRQKDLTDFLGQSEPSMRNFWASLLKLPL